MTSCRLLTLLVANLWRPGDGGEVRGFFWKETVIVIKWTVFHEYCNVDLYLYNLIFVLVAYEAVSHRFYTTEKGEVFWKVGTSGVFFCVADCRKYNLYFIICSNLAMSERLPSGRFTKEQSFSRAIILKTLKAPFQTRLSVTDLMTQIMS